MPIRVMTHDEKETAIEFTRANGTLKSGANAAGVTFYLLKQEIKRSPIFAKRIMEAQADGRIEVGDRAVENIKRIASEDNKDVRSRLTANIALANWAVPGFRGESKVSGHIDHDVRVVSAVPRPVYKDITKVQIQKPKALLAKSKPNPDEDSLEVGETNV